MADTNIADAQVTTTQNTTPPVTATAPVRKAKKAKCVALSPEGMLPCQLDEHDSKVVHEHSKQTLNGPIVVYW